MAGLPNAVLNNRLKQLGILLKLGGDVNCKSPSGETLLMLATKITPERAGLRMVKILVQRGANVKLLDNHGRNGLMHAVLNDKPLIVEFLCENCAELNLNAIDKDMNTALHYATGKGKLQMVKSLVKALRKYRLDLSSRNNHGNTPLMEAIVNNNIDVELYIREIMGSKNVPKECFGFLNRPDENCSKVTPTSRHYPRNYDIGTSASKFARSRTVPVLFNLEKSREENRPAPSESSASSMISETYVSSTLTLPKLYEIWQGQLTASYKATAVPIYEEYVRDENPKDVRSVQNQCGHRSLNFGGEFLKAPPICVSPVQRCKSSIEMSSSNNRGPEDSLLAGSEPFPALPTRFAGRRDSNILHSTLRVPSFRRSRSVSPRPAQVALRP